MHGYWLKNFRALHQITTVQLQHCINDHQAPKWMTTGRTTLVQKNKSKGNVASNYRPITCLPVIWKPLAGIISERLYNYLEDTDTIPHQQKSCERKCRGTKDQLLIDKMVMMNSKRRKTNLSMAIDRLQKGFRHDATLMASRMTGNKQCRGQHHQIPQEHNAQLEDNSYKLWIRLAKVNIRRGIFLGDSLSHLLFTVAVISITRVLERMEVGYQLKKGGS